MFAVDPHFLQAAVRLARSAGREGLVPGVDEGMPVWRLAGGDVAAGFAQPLVGLDRRAGRDPQRATAAKSASAGSRSPIILFGAVTLSAVFVIRETTTASTFSLPGTAFLCDLALRRARTVSLMPARVLATTARSSSWRPLMPRPRSSCPPTRGS